MSKKRSYEFGDRPEARKAEAQLRRSKQARKLAQKETATTYDKVKHWRQIIEHWRQVIEAVEGPKKP